ncbi:hypothetical protein AC477_03685 [miscellaneous Crenarchaeota group-1 archaeon SG8-32-1]|uniref:Uncharacterized protein n=1 Tax=miscellaneous Crenarchaeota group-1 archaeon SG8-32-1 TaxID=1685124 RepID=A0A0M0BTE1_9ARCH|nr:MAG: hypothetical protein AC477_03685 [miscellaneous Crenarchaeota group-1 archaeon SG8-32-1]
MKTEKVNIEELARKVDELLSVLNVISGDLSDVSKALKNINETKVTPPVSPSPSSKKRGLNEIKQIFSTEIAGMLLFEEIGSYIVVKPKRFLGSDNFAKIASVVRELGGEYISAGKNSHFKIPK